MDLYLLAEQNFHNIDVLKYIIDNMVNKNEIYFTGRKNVARIGKNKTITTYLHDNERFDIKNLLRHPSFPLRRSYLSSKAVAYSLRDFADRFRALADLPPIPSDLFEESDVVKEAMEIDFSLPSIEEVLREEEALKKRAKPAKLKQERSLVNERDLSSWASDALRPVKPKVKAPRNHVKAEPKIAKISKKARDINHPTKSEDVPSPIVLPVQIKEEVKKLSLNDKVYRLLTKHHQEAWCMLCSMKENALTNSEVNDLTMSVYRALIDLNKGEQAAEFLKRYSDSRIFSKGKEHQKLTIEDLEYKLLPYALNSLVCPDFTLEELTKKSSFLAKRVAADKLKLFADNIDVDSKAKLEAFLNHAEEIIKDVKDPTILRALLINQAHAWHKLAIAVENKRRQVGNEETLKNYQDKISSLLIKAQTLVVGTSDVRVLEAYLYSYYLNVDLSPKYDSLSPSDRQRIKEKAAKTLENHTKAIKKTIDVVTPSGKKISEYEIEHSLFHAVTNDELYNAPQKLDSRLSSQSVHETGRTDGKFTTQVRWGN